ncbi:MAG: galactose mutarotase [Bacteroidales bacterium]|nr:galactose mutarotase [Bacteroidales bacterium]
MQTMRNIILTALAALMLISCGPKKGSLTVSGLDAARFDSTYNDLPVALYTLKNTSGMEVCITNFGGRIVSIAVPDRSGKMRDVVLGFDNIRDYFPENNDSNFGAVIGRYGNRINQGLITIDSVQYQLPRNNYGHCLHGGPDGWHYRVFEVVDADNSHIRLALESPDGDAGFPGTVKATVTYTLTAENALDIVYEATTDAPTVINMTNHSYFNLSGEPENHTILDDELTINASGYTPVDDTFMTTGEIATVEGTPFDFRKPKLIGEEIEADNEQLHNGHGYDHNWVLDTGGDISKVAAELYCPATGIDMRIYTIEPGLQVYVGNFLDGSVRGKRGVAYEIRTAICMETQHYPDSPNKPQWPSVELRPGETYLSHSIYAFGVK